MPYFTAINARMIEARKTALGALPATNEGDGPRPETSRQLQTSRKRISRVSKPSQATTDADVPGDITNQRISGRCKKRSGRSNDRPATKRSKSSEVDVSMHTPKSGVTTGKKDPDEQICFKGTAPSSTGSPGVLLSSKAKLDDFRYNNMRLSGDTNQLMGDTPPPLVNTPQTSMNIVSSWLSEYHFKLSCSASELYFLQTLVD